MIRRWVGSQAGCAAPSDPFNPNFLALCPRKQICHAGFGHILLLLLPSFALDPLPYLLLYSGSLGLLIVIPPHHIEWYACSYDLRVASVSSNLLTLNNLRRLIQNDI